MANIKKISIDGTSYNIPGTTYGIASTTALGLIRTNYTQSGQNYPVKVDSSGNAYVNVPWSDVNTWRPITNTYTGSDPTTSVSQYGTNALYNALISQIPTKTSEFINDGENGTINVNLSTIQGPYTKDTTKSIVVNSTTLYATSMSTYIYVSNNGWVENYQGIRAYNASCSIAILNVPKDNIIIFYHDRSVPTDTYRNLVNAQLIDYNDSVVRFKMTTTGTFKVEMRYGTSFTAYITSINFNTIINKYVQNIELANVAKSGSYNDLTNKPTIPTVNNATLTIQRNGTTIKTFTANASSNVTANITVPTNVSELSNDAGYTTNTGTVTSVKVGSTSYPPSSGVVSLPAYPTSLPASDVSSWAKASSKPSYSWSEITSKPSTFTPASHSHDLASTSSKGMMSAGHFIKVNASNSVDANAFTSSTLSIDFSKETYFRANGSQFDITLSCSIGSNTPTAAKAHVLIHNSDSSRSINVNIPNNSSYVSCDGVYKLVIPPSKVGEIDIIYANSKYYIRTII